MNKIFTIVGSFLLIAIFLGLVLWTGQDQKLANLAEKIKRSQEKAPEKMAKNLESLATLKKGELPKY